MREGMAVYLVGLLLLTAGIELTLALLLASQGKVPSPSSEFWVVYLGVNIAFYTGGGVLVPRGLGALRGSEVVLKETVSENPPPG